MTEKILAFFEDKHSLSFNILFKELKNGSRIIYLRPYIKISNNDREVLNIFLEHFDIENKNILSSSYNHSQTMSRHYTINIQTMADADVFLAMYKEYIFLTEKVRSKYERFLKCYNYVKEIGNKHTSYIGELDKFVDLKLLIHENDDSVALHKKQLLDKIKYHLVL